MKYLELFVLCRFKPVLCYRPKERQKRKTMLVTITVGNARYILLSKHCVTGIFYNLLYSMRYFTVLDKYSVTQIIEYMISDYYTNFPCTVKNCS